MPGTRAITPPPIIQHLHTRLEDADFVVGFVAQSQHALVRFQRNLAAELGDRDRRRAGRAVVFRS